MQHTVEEGELRQKIRLHVCTHAICRQVLLRVFYRPQAQSYQSRSLPSLFRTFAENEKKRERITEVEHGNFTPMVFSACGGMGAEASVVVKKLASSLAAKRNETYSHFVAWIRCCLAFGMGDLHHVIVRSKNSSGRCCAAGWVALGGTQSSRSHDSCLCPFFRRSSREKCSARMPKSSLFSMAIA